MNSADYSTLLDSIKAHIRAARLRAVVAVNSELVLLYWHVGTEILKRQGEQGWGAKVVDRLSGDLIREFPDMRVRFSDQADQRCFLHLSERTAPGSEGRAAGPG